MAKKKVEYDDGWFVMPVEEQVRTVEHFEKEESMPSLLTNEPPAIGGRWYVVMFDGDAFFSAQTEEECQTIIEGATYLNRYFRGGRNSLYIAPANGPAGVTNPYQLAWVVSWERGQMGWDAKPMTKRRGGGDEHERVMRNNADSKQAIVRAPSALLAIERAKLAMTIKENIL